jgi:hypothetical protein
LKEQDLLREIRQEALRKEVRQGFEQIERGEYATYTSATEIADKIKAEGRKRAAGRKKSSV